MLATRLPSGVWFASGSLAQKTPLRELRRLAGLRQLAAQRAFLPPLRKACAGAFAAASRVAGTALRRGGGVRAAAAAMTAADLHGRVVEAAEPLIKKFMLAAARSEIAMFAPAKFLRGGVWLKRPVPQLAPEHIPLPSAVSARVDKYVAEVLKQPYWSDMEKDVRANIAEAIRGGLEDGLSGSEVADQIEEMLGEDRATFRAERIARTESNRSLNMGAQAGREELAEAGAISTKTWLAILDKATRDDHAEADGQTVPYDEDFIVGGEECSYPGDFRLSPDNSINCRCACITTLSDEAMSGQLGNEEDGSEAAFFPTLFADFNPDQPRNADGTFAGGATSGDAAAVEHAADVATGKLAAFRSALGRVTNVPVLRQIKAAGGAVKALSAKLYKGLEGRYGRAAAVGIMASGQTLDVGVTVGSALAGVPLYIPGLSLLGTLPAVAIAETFRQARKFGRARPALEAAKGAAPDYAALAREYVDQVAAGYADWLTANRAAIGGAFADALREDAAKGVKYSEDQPRTPDGRFGSGGGETAPAEQVSAPPRATVDGYRKANDAVKSYKDKPTAANLKKMTTAMAALTVKQLGDLKTAHGVKASGRKAELAKKIIERLKPPPGVGRRTGPTRSAGKVTPASRSKVDKALAALGEMPKYQDLKINLPRLAHGDKPAGKDIQEQIKNFTSGRAIVDRLAEIHKESEALRGKDLTTTLELQKRLLAVDRIRAGAKGKEADKAKDEIKRIGDAMRERSKDTDALTTRARDELVKAAGASEPHGVAVNDSLPDKYFASTYRNAVQDATQFVSGLLQKNSGDGRFPDTPIRATTEGRSFWDHSAINMSKTAGAETLVHEFGHRIESALPGAARASQEFLAARTKGEALTSMARVDKGYDASEMGRRDDWEKTFGGQAAYVGKHYASGSTEILSMGLEKMYKDPLGFARSDPEYATFVLGQMSGHLRK